VGKNTEKQMAMDLTGDSASEMLSLLNFGQGEIRITEWGRGVSEFFL
jgi:hypothetical protein